MYHFLKLLIIPILSCLKNNKNKNNTWRDLSNDEMVLPYKDVKKNEKNSFKQLILIIFLNFFYFLFKFVKVNKKKNKKKVSANYYPIN